MVQAPVEKSFKIIVSKDSACFLPEEKISHLRNKNKPNEPIKFLKKRGSNGSKSIEEVIADKFMNMKLLEEYSRTSRDSNFNQYSVLNLEQLLPKQFVASSTNIDATNESFRKEMERAEQAIQERLEKLKSLILHLEQSNLTNVLLSNIADSEKSEEIIAHKLTYVKLLEEYLRTSRDSNFNQYSVLNLKQLLPKQFVAFSMNIDASDESFRKEMEKIAQVGLIQERLEKLENRLHLKQSDSFIVHRSNSVDSRSEEPAVSDSSSVSDEDETFRLHSWLNRMDWVTSWYYGYNDDTLYIVVRDTSEKEVRRRLQDDNFHETGPLRIVVDEPTSQRVVGLLATNCMC